MLRASRYGRERARRRGDGWWARCIYVSREWWGRRAGRPHRSSGGASYAANVARAVEVTEAGLPLGEVDAHEVRLPAAEVDVESRHRLQVCHHKLDRLPAAGC